MRCLQKGDLEAVFRSGFKLEAKVELRHLSKNKKHFTEFAGNGICTFDKNGLTYKGIEYGKEIEKTFSIKNGARILFGAGEDFEIYENDELFYFVPEDKRSCVLWYILSELTKEEQVFYGKRN